MSVRFIIGPAGAGKTTYCINQIADFLLKKPQKPAILLVPEQATYLAERAFLADRKIAGYYSPSLTGAGSETKLPALNVLSFERLVFLLLGKNTARPQISNIGRQMIIKRILLDKKGRLELFAGSADTAGISAAISQTITELQQYAKNPDNIRNLVNTIKSDENNLSAMKFTDIALIFDEYLKFIEGRFLDPDIQLNLARLAVKKSGALNGAHLWIDGFAGFTSAELALLTELIKTASDVHIALCLDSPVADKNQKDPRANLFDSVQTTYKQLTEIVSKCKLPLDKPLILEKPMRFSANPALAHLERNLFKLEPTTAKAPDKIKIIKASDARAEAHFVARQIHSLIRDKNLRYRDIAVITPQITAYEHYITSCFEDYNIPYFIDRRKPLRHHPAVCFLLSALRAATAGFANSDIFDYLKSTPADLEPYDVDLLENYCIAYGIKAKEWTQKEPWDYDDKNNPLFDEQRVNNIRQKTIAPLIKLKEKLNPDGKEPPRLTAAEFTEIVFDFAGSLGLDKKISEMANDAIQRADYQSADEHQQLYDNLVNIFDELCEAFEGAQLTAEQFLSILTSAFSQMTLALIPPSLDQVTVGSIERSRHPDLKAVFLIGTTQKDFPAPLSSNGLLTDQDRLAAQSADFELAPTSFSAISERSYLAYIAFTRPSEFLYITYPACDEKAREVVRSQFVDNLEDLFDNLQEQPLDSISPSAGKKSSLSEIIESIYTESDLKDFLCTTSNEDIQVKTLIEDMTKDDALKNSAQIAAGALKYNNKAELDKKVAKNLFTKELHTSVSRLETFAACPYKYFSRYILDLRKRKEAKFEPLDLGLFYHRVLDRLLKITQKQKLNLAEAGDDQLTGLVEQAIEQIMQTDSFLSAFCRQGRHNTYIIMSACENLNHCVRAIAQMLRVSSFTPAYSEANFGKDTDTLGQFTIPIDKNRSLSLYGIIDRLDKTETQKPNAAIIFDYKRRPRSFDWSKFSNGLDLQLAVYMLAVRNSKKPEFENCDIAGAFYFPVETTTNKPSNTSGGSDYQAKGIFNGSFARLLEKDVKGQSLYYNFYVSAKEGTPYGYYNRSGALTPEDFEKNLALTEEKIIELAKEILSGKIVLAPYKLSGRSACQMCDYKSLCRFDWQINEYNYLSPKDKKAVLGITE